MEMWQSGSDLPTKFQCGLQRKHFSSTSQKMKMLTEPQELTNNGLFLLLSRPRSPLGKLGASHRQKTPAAAFFPIVQNGSFLNKISNLIAAPPKSTTRNAVTSEVTQVCPNIPLNALTPKGQRTSGTWTDEREKAF